MVSTKKAQSNAKAAAKDEQRARVADRKIRIAEARVAADADMHNPRALVYLFPMLLLAWGIVYLGAQYACSSRWPMFWCFRWSQFLILMHNMIPSFFKRIFGRLYVHVGRTLAGFFTAWYTVSNPRFDDNYATTIVIFGAVLSSACDLQIRVITALVPPDTSSHIKRNGVSGAMTYWAMKYLLAFSKAVGLSTLPDDPREAARVARAAAAS